MWEFILINTVIIRVQKLFLFSRREGQGRILSGFKNTLLLFYDCIDTEYKDLGFWEELIILKLNSAVLYFCVTVFLK